MKTSTIRFWIFLGLLRLASSLGAQTMDPRVYLETSRAAVSLPRVVAAYNDYIDEQDPVMFGVFDLNIATDKTPIDYLNNDPMNGRFWGLDGYVYARLFRIHDISFRTFFLMSLFSYTMDAQSASSYGALFDYDTELLWASGYYLLGLQARRGLDRVTLGAVLRVEPVVDEDDNWFDYRNTDDGVRTERTSFDRFYADVSISGWRLDTLVSPSYLEQIAAEKLFDIVSQNLKLGPVVEYLGRAASFRPGVSAEWNPASWFEASVGAKLGIGSGTAGLGEAGLSAAFPLTLARDVRGTGKDTILRLEIDASVCDFDGSLAPGGKAEISLVNYSITKYFDLPRLRNLGSAALGVSWNHADTLVRMPFENQWILYFRVGGGWYKVESDQK